MASQAQIRANQQNAQKSTGPTSIEGKKKSSMNAVTHGIFSNIAILPGEDEVFIQSLREDILATYQPQDTMERCLVDRINIAMQRCLAKAISLHGIGLYIYAGEDLPIVDQGIGTDNPHRMIAQEVTDQIKLGNIKLAHERCEGLNQEDKLGVWSLLGAKKN
jgi:hypothetical protein